jgi:hypothetical protein
MHQKTSQSTHHYKRSDEAVVALQSINMNHGETYKQARGRTMQPNLKKNSPTLTVPKGWRDTGLCLFVRDSMPNYNSRGLYLYPGLDMSPN